MLLVYVNVANSENCPRRTTVGTSFELRAAGIDFAVSSNCSSPRCSRASRRTARCLWYTWREVWVLCSLGRTVVDFHGSRRLFTTDQFNEILCTYCMHTHTHTRARTHARTHARARARLSVSYGWYVNVHALLDWNTHSSTHTHTHTFTHTHTRARTHQLAATHTHTHNTQHTHTHTHTRARIIIGNDWLFCAHSLIEL